MVQVAIERRRGRAQERLLCAQCRTWTMHGAVISEPGVYECQECSLLRYLPIGYGPGGLSPAHLV